MPASTPSSRSSGTTPWATWKPLRRYAATSSSGGRVVLLVVVMSRRWADRMPPVLPAPSPDVHDPRVPLRYLTWPGVSAGFHAEVDGAPDDGLLHAGETWAGGSWF